MGPEFIGALSGIGAAAAASITALWRYFKNDRDRTLTKLDTIENELKELNRKEGECAGKLEMIERLLKEGLLHGRLK